MIKVQYKDEIGTVEASFDTISEYDKFKKDLVDKFIARREEEKEKAEKEAEELLYRVASRWNELKRDADTLVAKAKEFHVTPNMFIELIKEAMYNAAEDRCEPAPVEVAKAKELHVTPNEPKIDADDLKDVPVDGYKVELTKDEA